MTSATTEPARLATIHAAPALESRVLESRVPESRKLFFTLLPSIMLPMFLASVDGTIVATALPAIAGELGEVEQVSWTVVSYLVAATIAAPVYGRLGDVLGRRRLLFVALSVILAASGLCAAATSVPMLIFARVLQGFGGGGLMTLSQALVGEAVPPRERGRYQGYLASVFVCSSMFGPVAGGWLTQHWGWRSVFLINFPIGILALLLALRLPRRTPASGKLHFDFLGLGLFAAFIASAAGASNRPAGSNSPSLPAALGLGAVAVISLYFLLRQERRATAPLLPVQFLGQAAVWRADAHGRLRRRHPGFNDHLPADLHAGGARHRPQRIRRAAAAADRANCGRLDDHRAANQQDRPHRDHPLLRPADGGLAALCPRLQLASAAWNCCNCPGCSAPSPCLPARPCRWCR